MSHVYLSEEEKATGRCCTADNGSRREEGDESKTRWQALPRPARALHEEAEKGGERGRADVGQMKTSDTHIDFGPRIGRQSTKAATLEQELVNPHLACCHMSCEAQHLAPSLTLRLWCSQQHQLTYCPGIPSWKATRNLNFVAVDKITGAGMEGVGKPGRFAGV
ncbi:hypothetical protein AXG93_2528s1990 [Marchantia polymorpha subsp. ruderalis]|uniref:Uncharacterized protein n=1 Tax=Marchantia polymorpha subsp. ruderalis TaxID=1480154 RepID=A0A176WQE1_MARPO|nr:hypothetical protein AXG93_2528s1990 [Marchantia polymorpha subsp. ruderalis]